MIINQENSPVVPDKTIAFFPIIPNEGLKPLDLNDIGLFLKPLNTDHKREWFTPHFYKCLPLSIGNMQGFVFSLPYTISVFWNGGNETKDVEITYYEDFVKYEKANFIYPSSEFGNGILTIHFPLTLKTPPGVNLMTISPPNFPLPGLSPMTGVIESDNIRFTFTLNIKIDLPNAKITIKPDTPLVGIIPIPRYFCDSFELKNAYDIFDKKFVEEEVDVVYEHGKKRNIDNDAYNSKPDRIYYLGGDIKGNKFKDHQLPKKNKK
jgi:hypothetical protein